MGLPGCGVPMPPWAVMRVDGVVKKMDVTETMDEAIGQSIGWIRELRNERENR